MLCFSRQNRNAMNDAGLNFNTKDSNIENPNDYMEDVSSVVDLLPVPVLVCNSAGVILYYNKAVKAFTSDIIETGAELHSLKWTFFDRNSTAQQRYVNTPIQNILKEQTTGTSEFIIENPDGERRTLTVTVRPNKTGLPEFILTVTGIATQPDLRAEIETANYISSKVKLPLEHIYRMIDEVQDYAIIMLDKSGNILNWNKGAERIKGYSADEIIGKNFRQFYLPEDNERNLPLRLIEEALQNGRALHEGWRVRKNGTIFWGAIVITAVHDESDNVIGFTKVTRDLTDRKAYEDKIKNYSAELEFKNRELEEFAYIASHDLQEPLRKIQVFASIMKESVNDPEKTSQYLQKIISSSERMSVLIQEVLRYARLAEATERTTVDLNTALKHALEDYEILIKEKKAQIQADFLPLVKGHEVQLRQLFSNLLGNALKFASPDRIPRISITSSPAPHTDILKMPALRANLHYHKFEITDNGLGFSEEFCGKIFKMFQRADNIQEGSGIGLALCQKVVNNHYGYIKADSELGSGTKFTLYLPAIF